MEVMYDVSTWRLVASQGSGGASPMAEWSYPLLEESLWMICMMSTHGVLLLHRGVWVMICMPESRSWMSCMMSHMASCCFTGEWWGSG